MQIQIRMYKGSARAHIFSAESSAVEKISRESAKKIFNNGRNLITTADDASVKNWAIAQKEIGLAPTFWVDFYVYPVGKAQLPMAAARARRAAKRAERFSASVEYAGVEFVEVE